MRPYAWFTEAFDTKDLKDAKARLAELEASMADAMDSVRGDRVTDGVGW